MKRTKAMLIRELVTERDLLSTSYNRHRELVNELDRTKVKLQAAEKLAEDRYRELNHTGQMYRAVCRANGQLANAVVNQAEALEHTK